MILVRACLSLFREILNGVNKVEQEVTAEKGFEVGTIRVGVFRWSLRATACKNNANYWGETPGLAFELFEGTIEEIKHGLESRIIDVDGLFRAEQ